jgi:hypothetical protein
MRRSKGGDRAMSRVRLIPHEESFEVRFPNGERKYFYFDDNAGRRAISGRVSKKQALQDARAVARGAQDKLDAANKS